MSDEAALLAGIAAAPHAALPRLVYADWLDDCGDRRGELVRLEIHLVANPSDDAALIRFRDLAAAADPCWLTRFVRPEVVRCGLRFALACPMKWADMTPTADPTLRHCHGCGRTVQLSTSRAQAWQSARDGRCVAVDRRLVDPIKVWPAHEADPPATPLDSLEPLAGFISPTTSEADLSTLFQLTDPDRRPRLWDRLCSLVGRRP